MRRLLVGLLGALLAVTACTPVSPQTAAQARALKLGINGAPVQVQLPETPRTMSPFAPLGSAELRLAQMQYLPLVAGSDGQLVDRVAGLWSPLLDGKVWLIYTARHKWSDGTEISAADAATSLEAHLDPRSGSPFAGELMAIRGARDFREGRAPGVSGIVVDQHNRLVITLEEPNPRFMEHLTQIPVMPTHIYPTRDAMVTADYKQAKVGSSAFVLDRWNAEGSVDFALNPLAAAKADDVPPKLLGAVARPVRPADVATEMAAGRLDVADSQSLRPESLPPGVRLDSAPGNAVVTLTPAPGRLTDRRVRQAIFAAIDRSGLVASELGGRGRATDSLLFQAEWATPPDRATRPVYDPEKARRLLAEAKWNPATPVRIAVVAESSRGQLWAKVADQLRAVGINAQVATYDPHDQTGLVDRADYDLLAGQWLAPMRHPSLVTQRVACGAPREVNTGQYCNPALDERLKRATAATTAGEEIERWRQAAVMLDEELPLIPLFVPDSSVAVSTSMGPIDPTLVPLTGRIDYWFRGA